MATKTTNYGLTKPDVTDFYDINVQNQNMDIIDEALNRKIDNTGGVATGNITVQKSTYPQLVVHETTQERAASLSVEINGQIAIQNKNFVDGTQDNTNKVSLWLSAEDASDDDLLQLTRLIDGEGSYFKVIHTGNVSNYAAPSGLIKGFASVETEVEINNAIDTFIAQTKDATQEVFLLEVTLSSVIPSDLYFITIHKYVNDYVTVTGVGIMSTTENNVQRKKVNGVWGLWKSSTDAVVTATVE